MSIVLIFLTLSQKESEMKKVMFVSLVLLVIAAFLGGCGGKPESAQVVATEVAEQSKFSTMLNIQYIYNVPNWLDVSHLPVAKDVEISYHPSSGWGDIEFGPVLEYDTVAMFTLSVIPEESNVGGCAWEVASWTLDSKDPTVFNIRPENECYKLEEHSVLRASVKMAYCLPDPDGYACSREGLNLLIGSEQKFLSFTYKGSEFLPKYRTWIEQIIRYFGGNPDLPNELVPGTNYLLKIK